MKKIFNFFIGNFVLFNVVCASSSLEIGSHCVEAYRKAQYQEADVLLEQSPRDCLHAHSPPNGATLLHYAAGRLRLEDVKKFVNVDGEDVDWIDSSGNTPLHYVCFFHPDNKDEHMSIERRIEIINIILDKKPSLLNAKNAKGQTALHLLASSSKVDKIFLTLLAHDVDWNVQDRHLRTPLHYACIMKQKAFIEFLINYQIVNINIHLDDETGKKAFEEIYPCSFDLVEVTLKLIEKYPQK